MDKVRAKVTIKNELLKAALGEFLGTAILVVSFFVIFSPSGLLISADFQLAINSVVAQSVLHVAQNKLINVNIGVGLGIAFGIAACARLSGGHINPGKLVFLSFEGCV
jgi:glycerol uptake facilitator-like aquaporin